MSLSLSPLGKEASDVLSCAVKWDGGAKKIFFHDFMICPSRKVLQIFMSLMRVQGSLRNPHAAQTRVSY